MFNIFKVIGVSMFPKYRPNEYVVTFKTRSLKQDDVIVFKDNSENQVIKRIKAINEKGFIVKSDNKSYPSSLHDEIFTLDKIDGKVIFKF
tara:strand:- start:169 stop:438 length:270 start_codon:yes stop_codon:yes gene_type:complete